jgi:hypothetical protein
MTFSFMTIKVIVLLTTLSILHEFPKKGSVWASGVPFRCAPGNKKAFTRLTVPFGSGKRRGLPEGRLRPTPTGVRSGHGWARESDLPVAMWSVPQHLLHLQQRRLVVIGVTSAGPPQLMGPKPSLSSRRRQGVCGNFKVGQMGKLATCALTGSTCAAVC